MVLNRSEVLDHGFVELVDMLGSDLRVVDAARVSVEGEQVKAVQDDRSLIRYLLRHLHTSPFEQVVLTFRAKMPIFVARQWVRHRTAAINEMSARYGVLPEEYYVPKLERIQKQSKDNKQGSAGTYDADIALDIQEMIAHISEEAFDAYHMLLGEKDSVDIGWDMDDAGIARELARTVLPVGTYTQWYWTINLWNFMHFTRLRLHPHAQYEIRVYGEAMYNMVKERLPISMEAFDDYILNAERFSAPELSLLVTLLLEKGVLKSDIEDVIKRDGKNMSKREQKEFLSKVSDIMNNY